MFAVHKQTYTIIACSTGNNVIPVKALETKNFPFRLAESITRNLGELHLVLKKSWELSIIPWPVSWVYGTVMITRECTKMSPAKVGIPLADVEWRVPGESYSFYRLHIMSSSELQEKEQTRLRVCHYYILTKVHILHQTASRQYLPPISSRLDHHYKFKFRQAWYCQINTIETDWSALEHIWVKMGEDSPTYKWPSCPLQR